MPQLLQKDSKNSVAYLVAFALDIPLILFGVLGIVAIGLVDLMSDAPPAATRRVYLLEMMGITLAIILLVKLTIGIKANKHWALVSAAITYPLIADFVIVWYAIPKDVRFSLSKVPVSVIPLCAVATLLLASVYIHALKKTSLRTR